jgi:hypothetical protein
MDMDAFSPEIWKHQWDIFISAPYVLMPLLVLALTVGWWIGSKLAGARIEGLHGTIDNLKANIGVLDDRLNFAVDRERDVQHARTELEKQIFELKAQTVLDVSNPGWAATSAKVGAAFTQFSTANNALAAALTEQDLEPDFYAQLERRFPGQADKLKTFVASLRPLGIEPKFGKSLFLRWRRKNGLSLSAGTIEPTGSVWLLKTVTDARALGNQSAGEKYLQTIARLTNGFVKRSENGSIDVRGPDARSLRLPPLIEASSQWKDAIEELINEIAQVESAR